MTNAPTRTLTRPDGATDLACGFASGTRIMTLRGAVAIETLVPGDRIVTRDGARQLIAVRTHRLRGVRPCRITRDTLGKARPERDMTVAPGQPILLRDWRAKALFDRDVAMVPAARLTDGGYITRDATPCDMDFHTLDLGGDHVIQAESLEFGATRP